MPQPGGSRPIEWAGEQWVLLADRAVWWPGRRMLIVADLHLGKAAAFRAAGVPVPEVVHAELERLDALIDLAAVDQLLVVGDLIHAAAGRTAVVIEAVGEWRSRRESLAITLVRGNHDRSAGDPPREWRMAVHDAPFVPFGDSIAAFVHDPDTESCEDLACIGGHLHPSVSLNDGFTGVRAPCFWVRQRSMVIPAFGRFTGTHAIRARRGERVFAVGEGQVIEVRTAGGIAAVPGRS